MNAQDFLKLVGKTLTAQQDYFKSRKSRQGDSHALLVNAKELEKQCLEIVQIGRLDPDERLVHLAGFVQELIGYAEDDDLSELLVKHLLAFRQWDEDGNYEWAPVHWLDELMVQRPTDEPKQVNLFGELTGDDNETTKDQ